MLCNHVYRDEEFKMPKPSKEALFSSIENSGLAGFWLHDDDIDFANKLVLEGKIVLCIKCNGDAAFGSAKKEKQGGSKFNI